MVGETSGSDGNVCVLECGGGFTGVKVKVLVVQPCPARCDPVDRSPQAPLCMGSSRQKYCSGLPVPPPGDLPDPGIKPRSPAWQAESLPAEPPGKPQNTGVGSLSLLMSPALQVNS